jgi:hypothetical protein
MVPLLQAPTVGSAMSATVRIVATNDLCGSVDPWPTSYGSLPGASAVIDTVRQLSDVQPTFWLDAGDFANWSALGSLTGGSGGFEAALELPFDAACPGNHEFDYGAEALLDFADRAPYPLVCGNTSLGLPSSTVLSGPTGELGILGLTAAESQDDAREAAARLAKHAEELRCDGCRWIVALLHDGMDWATDPQVSHAVQPDAARFRAWWDELLRQVDVVVAGHTLNRHLGLLDDVPVVQPWAFGAELAIVDLDTSGGHRIGAVAPEPGRPWAGAGRDTLDTAANSIHGMLANPKSSAFYGDHSLPDLLAAAARDATHADAAMFLSVYAVTQPSPDGVTSFLPAGPISELDINRLIPYPHDEITLVELEPGEWPTLRAALTPEGLPGAAQPPHPGWWQLFPTAPGVAAPSQPDGEMLIAFPAYFLPLVGQVLQRTPANHPGPGLKDALRMYLCEKQP